MHSDALKDGVRFENAEMYEPTRYFPPCCICGQETMVIAYNSEKRYTCKECRAENKARDEERRKLLAEESKEKRFEKAAKRMLQEARLTGRNYDSAIETIRKCLFRRGWFQSTEEIIVAMELSRRKIKTRHQVSFGGYKADFVLPEEKMVLEIDGKMFHNKSTQPREMARDMMILQSLGSDWEVIRISDTYVNKFPGLAIATALSKKKELQRVRSQNNGVLTKYHMRERYVDYKKDPYFN